MWIVNTQVFPYGICCVCCVSIQEEEECAYVSIIMMDIMYEYIRYIDSSQASVST